MSSEGLDGLAARLTSATGCSGAPVVVDAMSLLGERRALDGARVPATRILRCADGWVAVSMAREWDREAARAWLGVDGTWDAVEVAVASRTGDELVEGAELLGLAIGVLGETTRPPTVTTGFGPAVGGLRRRPRVLDLSALWAGPLCAALLGRSGADVVKLESTGRPDASREGTPNLFARLNGDKRNAVLDLARPEGRADLAALVTASDVVVESSRPRALEQFGVVAADVLAEAARSGAGPRAWVSVTGHGRASNRVGFGDDAAVAGGLVGWIDGTPSLWGDAAADPLAGLVAATEAAEALAAGAVVLLDVSLAGAAAALAPTLPETAPTPSPQPAPPAPRPLGADTDEVLAAWTGR